MEKIKPVSLKIKNNLDLTETITEYQNLQEEIINLEKNKITLEEYFRWRRRILPFLAKQQTKGRQFLFNLAFIQALVCSEMPGRRKIGTRILLNVIDTEFSKRIQEMGQDEDRKKD